MDSTGNFLIGTLPFMSHFIIDPGAQISVFNASKGQGNNSFKDMADAPPMIELSGYDGESTTPLAMPENVKNMLDGIEDMFEFR